MICNVVSLYTSDDCDDGVSAVHTVEQFTGITVSLVPQHTGSPLLQPVQSLLLSNVIFMVLMSDGVSG